MSNEQLYSLLSPLYLSWITAPGPGTIMTSVIHAWTFITSQYQDKL